jgi:hypothetical protein
METRRLAATDAGASATNALIAAQADVGAQTLARLAGRAGEGMVGDILTEQASHLTSIKYLAAGLSYATDQNAVGRSGVGRTAVAGARVGGDMVVDAAASGLVGHGLLSAGAAGSGSAFSLADSLVGDGRTFSVVTELGASLDVTANIQHGVHGAVDSLYIASLAARGDTAGVYQAADRMQAGTLNGGYGAVTQGYAAAAAFVAGDREALDTITDEAASTGERGTLAAWGNCAGETIHQVIASDYEDEGWTFVPDAR